MKINMGFMLFLTMFVWLLRKGACVVDAVLNRHPYQLRAIYIMQRSCAPIIWSPYENDIVLAPPYAAWCFFSFKLSQPLLPLQQESFFKTVLVGLELSNLAQPHDMKLFFILYRGPSPAPSLTARLQSQSQS